MPRELIFSATRKDFRVETFPAGGPGGQHQNKTDSAVRLTHKPTGISAECRSERSQHANKRTAFRKLAAKLVEWVKAQERERQGERERKRETIRTYHAIRGTAKDHRTKVTRPLDATLNGDLDPFIDAMRLKETEAA